VAGSGQDVLQAQFEQGSDKYGPSSTLHLCKDIVFWGKAVMLCYVMLVLKSSCLVVDM
jgi:hypothetical protein